MRAYSAGDEENLRTLGLLNDWTSEGFLSDAQHLTMQQDVPCGLRRTNVFLRLVFFLFTLISAVAAVGLYFAVFRPGESQGAGVSLLIFAALSYWGAEAAVSQKRLYRHGVEEALAVLSVIFLCVGLELIFFARIYQSRAEFIVPGCGAVASLLIYRRFGYQYAFLAAMICVAFMPHYWTTSHTAQHLFIAGAYAAGLITVIRARRAHHFDFVDDEYSITEALLWLGIYAAINLQISSIEQLPKWWYSLPDPGEFSKSFYWTTYALIWCLPAGMLWRALRGRDRVVARVGVIVAILTLITNKPYLGWQRHPWDPMLLGIVLTGVAVAVKRWLGAGEDGIRRGFTARRFSAADKRFQNLLSVGALATSPGFAPATNSDPTFSGGDTGGGGASSSF